MKKLIINALGIGSILTMLIMAVVTVGWKNKVDNDQVSDIGEQVNGINESENNLASMCNRIDRLSDNVTDIRPQNTFTRSKAYSSDLRHKFDESMFDDSYAYDPTDYPSENSAVNVNKRNVNVIDNYEEPKAADVIE
ncbi:MAG: hypothetical protein H8D56_18005 [Planctomycetes bacterium]|nr:hypothetical protein [Planctomycetota bacterium]MBL7144212.1 hypothetical protein [Phycisphaerae bacterium]